MIQSSPRVFSNSESAPPDPAQKRADEVQRVLWIVLVLNISVAAAKLLIGFMTGTLSMIADGFHSSLDASSNIVGIIATALAARPPDEIHPYGHRRFETMATLLIGVLLLVAAWEILKSALERVTSGASATIEPISFIVMLATMVVNTSVVIYERRQGKRLHSSVLLADASQTNIDIYISGSVIVGLIGTSLGLHWMDAAIAILIVVLIAKAAYDILRQTTNVLVDAAAINPLSIAEVIHDVPGVDHVVRVRSRGPSDQIYADVGVSVQPAITTDQASAIAGEIESRIKTQFEGVAEVTVSFEPDRNSPPDHKLIARAAADALGLSVHEITEVLTANGLLLEMHVEVSSRLTLAVAHETVTLLEERVRAAMPEVFDVITHIEPASSNSGAILQTKNATSQRDQALAIAKDMYPNSHWHDATIRPMMGGYAITMHCWLPGSVSVQEAHQIAEHVETQIRAALGQVQRVTIHTEPPET